MRYDLGNTGRVFYMQLAGDVEAKAEEQARRVQQVGEVLGTGRVSY